MTSQHLLIAITKMVATKRQQPMQTTFLPACSRQTYMNDMRLRNKRKPPEYRCHDAVMCIDWPTGDQTTAPSSLP